MKKLYNYIKSNWKNILLVLISSICLVLLFSTTCSTKRNNILQNNIKALRDTVYTLELKNGSLLYERQGLILEKNELKNYLDITEKEINELERKLKTKIDYISKLEGFVKIDTLKIIDSLYYTDAQTIIDFDYANEYISLSGTTIIEDSCSNTIIDNITVPTPLKVGVSSDNKIFVISENPYLYFTDIQGAQLKNQSTKNKNWSFSLHAGFGVQYGLINKKFDVGPYIGAGISYNF